MSIIFNNASIEPDERPHITSSAKRINRNIGRQACYYYCFCCCRILPCACVYILLESARESRLTELCDRLPFLPYSKTRALRPYAQQ